VAHANARLTPAGRLLLCQRVAAGRPVANVTSEMGISCTCAYCWWAPLPAARPGRPARPTQHRPHASQAPAHQRRGRDRAATQGPQARPGTDRGAGRPAGLHRPPRPLPAGPQPAGRHGPANRPGHPPLRTRPPRRAAPPRCQEARPAASRRWPPRPRPGVRPAPGPHRQTGQRPYESNEERTAALDPSLHLYNRHCVHTALGGHPSTRINNPAGHYS